jgi:hypothetical protein
MKRPWPTRGCSSMEKKIIHDKPPGYIFSDPIINKRMTEMSLITDFTQHTIKQTGSKMPK